MSYEIWYKQYQEEAQKLWKNAKQFKQRVTEWEKLDSGDTRLPKARFDYLQAGIKYNLFVHKMGDLIGEVETAIESRLARIKQAKQTSELKITSGMSKLI